MRWMKLDPIIQSEVSQKEKHHFPSWPSIQMSLYHSATSGHMCSQGMNINYKNLSKCSLRHPEDKQEKNIFGGVHW